MQETIEDQNLPEKSSFNIKKYKILVIFVMMLLLTLGSSLGIYFWQQSEMSKLTAKCAEEKNNLQSKIGELEVNVSDLATELDTIKNPPVPEYCEEGTVYENPENNYKVCTPSGWIKAPSQGSSDRVDFIPETGVGTNYIYITVSTDIIEDALNKYSKDLYVDNGSREYPVADVIGYQFFGTVKPDMKRGITVFSKNSVTFEIIIENSRDASYNSNVETYKSLVESFEFTE